MQVSTDTRILLVTPEELTVGFAVDHCDATLHDGTPVTVRVGTVKGSLLPPALQAPALVYVSAHGTAGDTCNFCIEYIPRHYFELNELATYGDGSDDFSRVDVALLAKARQSATETFEQNAHRSFVRRIGETRVFSLSDYVSLDHGDVTRLVLAPDGYRLVSDCQVVGVGTGDAAAFIYEYGTGLVPERVHDAVLKLAAYYLRPSAYPDRAMSVDGEAGFMRLTIAGKDGATGLPEVDAAITQFGREVCPLW